MSTKSHVRLRHIVPSLVTVFAICSGMTALRMSLDGRIETALYFVLLAVFLDAADGKLARFLDTASPFGAELDTLADFFNFGIVPGLLVYQTLYMGTEHSNPGWLATLVLAVCCALRLARFNLSTKSGAVSLKTDDFFVGVPAPAVACLALMPVFLHLQGWGDREMPLLRAAYMIGVGLLAISAIPTLSVKHANVPRAWLPFAIVAFVILVVCLMTYTWLTLIIVNCLYLASLPVTWASYQKRARNRVAQTNA